MPVLFFPLIILSMTCCWIEVDISVPGFPDMARFFAVDEKIIQYTLAINYLGFCLSSLILGPLSDIMGRRKVMIIGNFIMAIGACGCFLAHNIEVLLVARFIQGVGAATSAVISTVMIADIYTRDKATRLIGMMNAVATVLIAIAPVAGGFINHMIGWQGNYALVAMISVFSWVLLLFYLPETSHVNGKFSMIKIAKDAFVLLRHQKFMILLATPSLVYSAYMVFIASAAFLYMETFDESVMAYSFNQAIIVIAFSIISMGYSKIAKLCSEKQIIILGCILTVLGSVLGLIAGMKVLYITLSMVIYACGFAVYYPPIFTRSLEVFPELKGTASSLIMSLRALMVSAFIALGSNLYDGTASSIFIVMLPISLIVSFATLSLVIRRSL